MEEHEKRFLKSLGLIIIFIIFQIICIYIFVKIEKIGIETYRKGVMDGVRMIDSAPALIEN